MYLEMLCKESIVTWFKDLTSFKRIDVMCNLLQSCQPFETRFLGTCIEELGRKDFTVLRNVENIVNNPAELSTQELNNINDKETRSKLSQFLCVLHSTNKRCASEMYNILISLCEDVNNIIKSGALLRDDSPLDDLLLIYALGIFHPAFSFDKKIYIGDLLTRLMQEEERRLHIFKQKEMQMSPDNYLSDNLAMSQVPEQLPNPGTDESMLSSLPVLSYPPVLPNVMSHSSSPSGSPPIRSKPPVTPVDHKPVSPNPRLMNETEMPVLGMPPPGGKESRLIANGKPSEELWLQANIRRQAYVVPVFYAASPPPPSSSCSSCHNGGGLPPLSSPPDAALRLPDDQMRELRLGELPLSEGGGHCSPSSSESNHSETSPPSPTLHEMGRLPPTSTGPGGGGGGFNKSTPRGSNVSLGGPGSAHQYRRRPELNGHDPPGGLISGGGGGGGDTNYYPLLAPAPFLPPPGHPPSGYPPLHPMYPPCFPELAAAAVYHQQYPPPPAPPPPQQNLGPALYASPPLPTLPRLSSCYNCGSQSHVAPECPDPTIDEVSKQGQYRLDYEGSVNQFNSINDNN